MPGQDLRVRDISTPGFEAHAELDGETVRVVLQGPGDMRSATALAAFFTGVHADALRCGAREVSVDLSKVAYISSTCFKAIVDWLVTVQRAKTPGYRVRLRTDRRQPSQARSLRALSCFQVDLAVTEA
jgi:ABC-type transporter Mla MlaB component